MSWEFNRENSSKRIEKMRGIKDFIEYYKKNNPEIARRFWTIENMNQEGFEYEGVIYTRTFLAESGKWEGDKFIEINWNEYDEKREKKIAKMERKLKLREMIKNKEIKLKKKGEG